MPEPSLGDEIFRGTLSELERGLTAALITTRTLLCANEDLPVPAAEEQMERLDISQMPVKASGRITGIYHQYSGGATSIVGQHAQPINDSVLIAMNASLLELIHSFSEDRQEYRLVVGQRGIEGIVTKSDLQKLPVRLLAYSLVTHLESVMANLIQRTCPDEDHWLQYLSSGSMRLFPDQRGKTPAQWRDFLRRRQGSMEKEGIVPDLLDLTDFTHKYVILLEAIDLPVDFGRDMKLINTWLRNTVAHSRNLPPTDSHMFRFSTDIKATQEWTAYLGRLLDNEETTSSTPLG